MKKIILSLFVLSAVLMLCAKGIKVKAAATVTLTEGAAIRVTEPNGIKFQAIVSEEVANASYGMVFAQGVVSNLTVDTPNSFTAEVDEVDENKSYRVTMINFPTRAYAQNITVRAYIKNGETYIYSDNIVTRNLYEVAKAYQDKKGDETEQLVLDIINNCFEITFDANGGTYKYASYDAMVEDFLNDFNTITGNNVEASGLYGAGDVFGKFFDAEGMLAKWKWTLELFYSLGEQGKTLGEDGDKINAKGYGYHSESQAQYQTFLAGNGSTVSVQWAVRQALQGLMTQTHYIKYSTAAAIDFTNPIIANQIETAIGDNQKTVVFGKDALLYAPQNVYHFGYEFGGWYEDSECTIEANKASKVQTIYAKWVYPQWNIVDDNNISVIQPDFIVIPNLTANEVVVGGKTYYLGTSAFTTLTEAYDAASAGNSIYLSAGTYTDALTIAKNIKIYGPNYLISGTSDSRVEEAILTGNIDITSDALLSGISLQENATITLNSITSNIELQYIYNTSNGSTSGTYISTIFGTINKLVIDQSLFRMNVAEEGAHGIALTEAKVVDIKNSTFENSNYSSNAVAIRIKTIGTSVSITNNIINFSTTNFSMILGGTVNTAKTINICSNTISGNQTYYTSGIAVQNNTATTIVTIDSNQINYMNGNLYNFSGSQSGSKVYLTNNIYDVNSVFKLTSYGSASITSIGNTYGGGVSSTGYQPDDK